MKKIISFILVITLLCSPCCFPFADWKFDPEFCLDAKYSEGEVTVNLYSKQNIDISSLGFCLSYDFNKLVYNRTQNGVATGKGFSEINDAIPGEINIAFASSENTHISANNTIYSFVFKLECFTDDLVFSLTDCNVGSAGNGNSHLQDSQLPSETIHPPMSSVAVTGTISTPSKNANDKTKFNALTGVKTSVSWSPALENGKFAANTVYTATVTIEAAAGYEFCDNANVSFNGEACSKAEGKYTFVKAFEKTADKEITAIKITAAPYKTEYVHGDTFDKTGMVVTASYDYGPDAEIADYCIVYQTGASYIKYDDSAIVVRAGDKSAVTPIKVLKKNVTVSGLSANNKVYDGTTDATTSGVAVLNGIVPGEIVELTSGTAAFEDKNAGDSKTVIFFGYSLTGADAGNYNLSSQPNSVTAKISAKEVSISGINAAKIYDGTTTVSSSAFSGGEVVGIINGDKVTADLSSASGTAASADAASDISVVVSNVSISGADAENYALKEQPTDVKLSITKASAPNSLCLSDISVYYLDNDDHSVDVSGLTELKNPVVTSLSTDSDFIFINSTPTPAVFVFDSYETAESYVGKTATIKVNVSSTNHEDAELEVKVNIVNKSDISSYIYFDSAEITYGQNYTPAPSCDKFDNSGIITYEYKDSNGNILNGVPTKAGSYTVTLIYDDDVVEGSLPGHMGKKESYLTIKPKELTLSYEIKASQEYDGSTTVQFETEPSLVGVVGSDNVTISSESTATFDNKNAGENKEITFSYTLEGEDADNYTLIIPNDAKGNITAKEVTLSEVKASKIYDGTTIVLTDSFVGGTVNGKIENDIINIDYSEVSAVAASPNVGEKIPVSVYGVKLIGDDAGNYKLKNQPSDGLIDISPATVTILSVSVKPRAYEKGNVFVDVSSAELSVSSLVSGIDYSAEAMISDDNAGDKTATVVFTLKNTNYCFESESDARQDTSVVISKADVIGKPDYSVITEQGKTLADANLQSGTITIPGSVSWTVNDSTIIVSGESYGWIFIPDDINNYNTLEGSFVVGNFTPSAPIIPDNPISADSYDIIFETGEYGLVTADTQAAKEGDIVTFTITPNDGYIVDEVVADGVEITLYDGKYSFMMPASIVKVKISFKELVDPVKAFVDIDENARYYDGVRFCIEAGIMNGTSDTTFEPNAPITRGMAVTILYRLAGSEIVYQESPFVDLTQNWYKDAVKWAYENAITNGISETEFNPDGIMTREMLATLLSRYAKYINHKGKEGVELEFDDAVSVSDWALDSMKWCVSNGIVTGVSASLLAPLENASRAQTAIMIERFINNLSNY